jgi:type II secretion system protein D
MIKQHSKLKRYFIGAVGFCLCAALPVGAQFQGGQRGGGGFGGGGGRTGGSGSSGTRQYNNNSMVGDASVSSDPETRRLIVITDEETSRYIGQVVTNLDRPKPQVLIKVVFLEVTRADGMQIGLEGGGAGTVNSANKGNASQVFGLSGLNSVSSNLPMNALGQPIQSFQAIAPLVVPGAGLYQMLGKDYQVTLRAIAQAGKARVLSRPSILARNNQPATILVGQTVPLITSVRYDSLGNAINGLTYTDVGIILRVTPYITSDGMVEMIVSPEISSVSQTDKVQIQANSFAPVIDKRSADTVVVTPDSQTVVIGGLIQTRKAVTESKIPLLGDIPGLGVLFKNKSTQDATTELLIFLTPHIVYAPTQLAALSANEKSKSGLIKAFPEEELNRILDTIPTKEASPSVTSPAPSGKTPPTGKKKPAATGSDW